MSKPMHKMNRRTRWIHGLLGLALWLSLGQPLAAAPAASDHTRPARQSGAIVHVVQAGETLGAIAARYDTTVAALVEANRLENPDRLAIGQRLLIPVQAAAERPRLRYWVQPGDTWTGLASKFRIVKLLLISTNSTNPKTKLEPGQEIEVPIALDLAALGLNRFGITPPALQQGQAAALSLAANRPLTVSARYAGSPLAVVSTGQGQAWALFGVHPLAPPALTWLDVDIQGLALPARLRSEPDDPTLHVRWPAPVIAGSFETQHLVLPADKGGLLAPKLLADERVKLNALWPQHDLSPQWTGVFTSPLSSAFHLNLVVVSSPFGTRRSYNGGPVSSFHEGQDFGAPTGAVVTAPAPGVVVLAEALTVRGNAVILDHGAGLHTGYWHLSKIEVTVGQRVEAGDKLGEVGSTGLSTGAHLHWEMRVGLTPVDPLPWLKRILP